MTDGVRPKAEPCRNCGHESAGRFCPECGQRKGEVRVSLRRMLADVLEDQLSIDATLPRTLVAILFRPGHLTNEYLRGRIVSWVPPFRLYLAASVLFFLSLSIGNRTGELKATFTASGDTVGVVGAESAIPVGAVLDSLRAALTEGSAESRGAAGAGDTTGAPASEPSMEPGAAGSATGAPAGEPSMEPGAGSARLWMEGLEVHTGIGALDLFIRSRLEEMKDLPLDQALRRILTETLNRVPTAMFVLLPLFALILKLLYIRSGRYYVEHFVFALHYHAFAFLGFTLMLVLAGTPIAPFLGLWLFVYLWLALWRVYRQGFLLTSFKWIVLTWSYSLLLAVGLFFTAVVALILL